jgi:fatty-acyl-CoA synthase
MEGSTSQLSIDAGSDTPALLEDTIGSNLLRTVHRHGERLALVDVASRRRWTYRQFDDDVAVVARGLAARGVGKGDRVGIWAPNCPEWVLTQYATARLGAICVNINPAYRAHELAYVMKQSRLRTIVAIAENRGTSYAAMIEAVRDGCPDLVDVILIAQESWFELEAAGQASSLDLDVFETGLRPMEPINIQYTSGTTGFPKGATLSHRNILNNGYLVGELLGYTAEDRICVPVPFYHCFGMVMGNLAATSHGASIVIPSPAFEPAKTLEAIDREACTSVYGVPTMFIAMLNDPTFDTHDLTSLRTGIMAGSPCPVQVMKQVIERMGATEVSICYGMTETSPVSTQTRVDDSLERRVATVGRVHPHVAVKIIDPDTGNTLPRDTPGELCTRGYSVMLGYWDEPFKTAEAVDSEGWMHTGDLAVMDADGYVSITGRIKDMVIRGGENIYPREIEEFLLTHGDILDAQVVGVPDGKYGEELCAWIRMREGTEVLDANAIREFALGKLAHYKIPRYVLVVDEFPMTVTGKIRKVEMREESARLLGL